MKKNMSILLAVLFAAATVLSGCSSSGNKEGGGKTAGTGETQPSDSKTYTIKVGYALSTGSPVDLGVDKLIELVKEKTDGKLIIEKFPDSQLGGERDMLEGMLIGTVDSVITGDPVFPLFAPEYAGLSTAYAFEDSDHLLRVMNGEVGEGVKAKLNESLKSTVMDWWLRSPRLLTANKAILTPDDLKGLKIRTPEVPLTTDAWRALGANPTPIAFPELFMSLQQGVVDGQENPADLIYTSKFYEVQSHVMLTEHLIAPFTFLINNKKLESLPDNYLAALKEAIQEAGDYQKQVVSDSEQEYLQLLKDVGVTIVEVDKSLWRDKVYDSGVIEKYSPEWAPGLLDKINAAR